MTKTPDKGLRLRDVALGFDPEAFAIVSREDDRPAPPRRDIHEWLSGGRGRTDGSPKKPS